MMHKYTRMRFSLSAMLLSVVVAATGFALVRWQRLKPESVLRSANISVTRLRGQSLHSYVTIRESSLKTSREYSAISVVTSDSEVVIMDVAAVSADKLPRLLNLPNVRCLVVRHSDLSGEAVDLLRYPLTSASFINCDLSGARLKLPQQMRALRFDGSDVEGMQASISEPPTSLEHVSVNFVRGDQRALLQQVARNASVRSVEAYGDIKLSGLLTVRDDLEYTIGSKQLDLVEFDRARILVRSGEFVKSERTRLLSRSTDVRIAVDQCYTD